MAGFTLSQGCLANEVDFYFSLEALERKNHLISTKLQIAANTLTKRIYARICNDVNQQPNFNPRLYLIFPHLFFPIH
jgi:hypothetical protein